MKHSKVWKTRWVKIIKKSIWLNHKAKRSSAQLSMSIESIFSKKNNKNIQVFFFVDSKCCFQFNHERFNKFHFQLPPEAHRKIKKWEHYNNARSLLSAMNEWWCGCFLKLIVVIFLTQFSLFLFIYNLHTTRRAPSESFVDTKECCGVVIVVGVNISTCKIQK